MFCKQLVWRVCIFACILFASLTHFPFVLVPFLQNYSQLVVHWTYLPWADFIPGSVRTWSACNINGELLSRKVNCVVYWKLSTPTTLQTVMFVVGMTIVSVGEFAPQTTLCFFLL